MEVKIKPDEFGKNYHSVPCFLIYDTSYGSKRVLFQMGLRNNTMTYWAESQKPMLYHPIAFLRFLNFKATYNNKTLIDQANDFVKKIEEDGFVKKIKMDGFKTVKFYVMQNVNKNELFNSSSKFGIVYNFEFVHLLRLHKAKKIPYNCKIENVLLILAYLRQHIILRSSGDYNSKKNIKKKPETYVTSIEDIAEDIGIHRATASKCINALSDIGIIYHENLVRRIGERILNGRTIFANKYKYDSNQGYRLDTSYNYMKEVNEVKRQLKPYGEFGRKSLNSSTEIDD